MAAYIDLNPLRAGMVADPAEYRWSSYGEVIGGGSKGHGRTARAGLVRAWNAHKGMEADAGLWSKHVARPYRMMLMEGALERSEEKVNREGQVEKRVLRKGNSKESLACESGRIPFAKVLRCRVRYFTDGAVIGSREFVDEAFEEARDRFGKKRKSGARKLRGTAGGLADRIWSFRDLRKGIA